MEKRRRQIERESAQKGLNLMRAFGRIFAFYMSMDLISLMLGIGVGFYSLRSSGARGV